MSEPGLYALTKVLIGGISAVMTGPMGTTDLPETNLRADLGGIQSSYAAEIYSPDGSALGWAGHDRPGSPNILDLPENFIYALLSVEDAHYGLHPGVDPVAVVSAGLDTLRGSPRGGSTITQQLVKNAVTGADLTVDRKIREGIIAVRAQVAFPHDEMLQAYLAKAWFGRGQQGAAGAALAWFGKTWDEIEIHEAAFLAGILKGPAYYDPIRHPDRAKERRDIVITMMHVRDMISAEEMEAAKSLPLDVISEEESRAIFDQVPHWVATGISADLERYGLMNRSDISSGKLQITTTISQDWQQIAEEALLAGVNRLSTPGPALNVSLPASLSHGDDLSTDLIAGIRQQAANALATTSRTGRAIITHADAESATLIIDRGFGPLEWDRIELDVDALGYAPVRGDVLAYKRVNGDPVLQAAPQVQGAVVVMDPSNGAILASIGGSDPDFFPFDRTEAERPPGSSLKPFLWARAMEGGLRHDDLVEDRVRDYVQNNGAVWIPKNYDHSQSGLIPLFIALEESSNLVAASLVDQIGVSALATITELAGIYEWGGMRRHPSSALGASETSLVRMAAGYSALANGGLVVTPTRIQQIAHDGEVLWTPPGAEEGYAIATRATTNDVTSMLYGVTHRGTAYSAFRNLDLPVAGKTGTTDGYRDAWFMSFTPGVVVGVWVGRDDFKPIPGNASGSRAAAPVARDIYQAALDQGLLLSSGYQPGQEAEMEWPPRLLTAGNRRQQGAITQNIQTQQDPFKRDVPAVERSSYLSSPEVSQQTPRGGYLSAPEDANDIFPSPRSSESGLIFKSPW